jgi:hypothetical protein
MPHGGEVWLISRALCETHPHPDSRRAASLTTAIKTKALRIIFAGKLGSTPAVTTLLTANNRNVFIIFPPDWVTASPVMYTPMVGINVYSSSRNCKLFFGSRGPCRMPRWRRSLADLVALSGPGSNLVPEPWIEPGTYLPGVTLAFGREIFPETPDLALADFE